MLTSAWPARTLIAAVVACASLVAVPAAAESRKALVGKPLFRADFSAAPGVSFLETDENEDALAFGLGSRAAFNLGYAPSQLIRLGFGAGADFAMNLAEDQNITQTDVDGFMRWFAGPSIGFRFAPRVPLELEASIGFAHMMHIGSQATSGVSEPPSYKVGAAQFGMENGAILYYRPGGPRSLFAIHGGVRHGWAYGPSCHTFTWSTGLGVSVGL